MKPAKHILSSIGFWFKNRSWRFWTIAGYFAVVVVLTTCWLVFVYSPANEQVVEKQTENIILTAQSCAEALPHIEDPAHLVQDITDETDLRLTIISSSGSVIADSEMDPTTLDNHLQRNEIQQALQGDIGIDQRTSTSDGIQRLYVAVPSQYQGETVALRISEPLSSLQLISNSLQTSALLLVGVGVIVAILIALISLRQSSTPIRKLERVRTDFVANASHELKTPVAGIRLLSEGIQVAAETGDTENLTLFTERLDTEAERLQRLVVDLLDLSRLETAPNKERRPRADLHSTLVTSFISHKSEAVNKGLTLTLVDRSKTGDDCYADMEPSDASLIFDNIIENAIMYTDEGCVTVTFEVRAHDVLVVVEDSGIGIPQADQSRIFERFYRVDKARSREVGGTGLGLSLVRHAIERSNGTIKLKSEMGKGTRFMIILPQARKR